jgi:phosphoribosyl 1,2-cyclic phosphodiesterase
MKLTVLGSGSTGNAVLIVAGNTRVLVDAGLSAKEITRRLAMVGEDAQRLDAVLVTHEHGDHAGGLRVLLNSVDCPVYISGQTLDAYVSERVNVTNDEPRRRAKALRDRVEQIESSKDFRIGEIDFHQGVKIATVMDFGHITTLVTERLRGCAAIVIESNHSRDMLKACDNYPWELKQRILSRLGHLSNEDLADWIRKGFDGCAKYIVLAHLSQRANNPYLAKINAEVALQERAPLFVGFTEVSLSYPKEPTPWIEV